MVKCVVTYLVDDLDGSPIEGDAGHTVKFALDGTAYEIDLRPENVDRLHAALTPFIEAARHDSPDAATATAGQTGALSRRKRAAQLLEIRSWAEANGQPVSRRGRISRSIMQAYEAAH